MGRRTSTLRRQDHDSRCQALAWQSRFFEGATVSTPFLSTGDFTYFATVRPVTRPAGHLNLRITSRWASAKDPKAEQVALDLTLSQAEVATLIQTLQAGLAAT